MKFTIIKVTMGNDSVHYKIRYTKWNWLKKYVRSWNYSNDEFRTEYDSYQYALTDIDNMEVNKKANTKKKRESFPVRRTHIPDHVPTDQRLRYISTPKLTDL